MIGDQQLAKLLLKTGLTTPGKLEQAKVIQKRHGGPLYLVLLENGLCDERQTVAEVATRLGVPHVSLTAYERLPTEVLDAVVARRLRVVPVSVSSDEVYLAMADPSDSAAIREVSGKLGRRVQALMAGPLDVDRALERGYGTASVNTRSAMLFGSTAGFSTPTLAARSGRKARKASSGFDDPPDETLDQFHVEVLEPEEESIPPETLDSAEIGLDSGELDVRSADNPRVARRHGFVDRDKGNTMIGAAWTDEDIATLRNASKPAPFLSTSARATPPPVPQTGEFISPVKQVSTPTGEDLAVLERYDTRTLALFLLRRVLNAGLVHPEEVLDEIERYAGHVVNSSGS